MIRPSHLLADAIRAALLSILLLGTFAARASDIQTVRAHLNANQLAQAELAIVEILTIDPNHIEAQLIQGVILARRGELDQAITSFTTLIRKHPELPQPYNNLAAIYAGRGDFEQARAILLRAIEGHPDYPVARENLGDLYANMAQLAYQQTLQLAPGNARVREKMQQLKPITGKDLSASDTRQLEAVINNPIESSTSCLLIGPFKRRSERHSLMNWLRDQGLKVSEESVQRLRRRTMVYLSAGKTTKEANELLTHLKTMGIRDMSLTRNRQGDRVISLGIFGKQSSVDRRLKSLNSQGLQALSEDRSTNKKRNVIRLELSPDQKLAPKQIRGEAKQSDLVIQSCS